MIKLYSETLWACKTTGKVQGLQEWRTTHWQWAMVHKVIETGKPEYNANLDLNWKEEPGEVLLGTSIPP